MQDLLTSCFQPALASNLRFKTVNVAVIGPQSEVRARLHLSAPLHTAAGLR
jgi:hypothetical protein